MTVALISILVAVVTLYLVREIRREGEPKFVLRWLAPCETRWYVLPTGEMVMAPGEDKPAERLPPDEWMASSRSRRAPEQAA